MQKIHPFAQYLVALAATIAIYGGYVSWVAPRIEGPPPVVRGVGSVELKPAEDNRVATELAPWIAADSWELGPCKTLRNGEATMYCRDYVTLDDGSIQIFPLTIVLRAKDASEPPIIIRASEQAILQFDRPLAIGSSEGPGRLLNARMPGPVELFQPGAADQLDDGLYVQTSNLQLTPRRIFTIEPVKFRHSGSHGSGRNLVMDLSHTTPPGAINTGFSTVNGLTRMELAFVDYLELYSEKVNGPATGEVPGKTGSLQSARVHCQGPLVFDFEKQTALFRDEVVVRSMDDSGDVLTGDELEVFFDRQGGPPNPSADAATQKPFPKLKPSRIVARGTPARLLLPSRNANAAGELLEYDMAMERIRANDSHAVIVNQGQQEFVTRSLEYRMRGDGSLGPMMAQGPGRLVSSADDSDPTTSKNWTVSFEESLTILPEPDGKLITVKGEASVVLDQEQQIRGEQIRLWLNQQQVHSAGGNGSAKWDYQPTRMEVDGTVNMGMKGLTGITGKLIAIWNDMPIHAAGRSNRIGFLQPAPMQNLKAPLTGPVYGEDSSERTQVASSVYHLVARPVMEPTPGRRSANPMNFRGDAVTIQLMRQDTKSEVQSVEIDGNVVVEQLAEVQPGGARDVRSLLITGNRLNLTPVAPEMWRAHVAGNATIDSPQLLLRGENVHMDQSSNRVWVVGAGDLEMKQSQQPKVPAIQASAPNGSSPKSPEFDSLNVSWLGGMIFDGSRVWFEQQVRSQASQNSDNGNRSDIRSLSQGLTVTLDRQVDFQSQQRPNDLPAPKVRQLILIDRLNADQQVFDAAPNAPALAGAVVLERSEHDPAGKSLARQVIVVPQVDFDVSTGDVVARGPGGLVNWQPSSGNQPSFGQPRQNVPSAASSGSSGISCLHVNFDKQLSANSNRGELEIDGNVRAAFGNVDSWERQLDPNSTTPILGVTRMVCQHVRLVQWQKVGAEAPTINIDATGDALIQGEAFEARGVRISWEESSGRMDLWGDGRTDAKLFYKPKGSASQDTMAAGKITYFPATQTAEFENVQSASMNRSGK